MSRSPAWFSTTLAGIRGGWAGLLSLLLLLLLWQAGHLAYGDFVLPSPAATVRALVDMIRDGRVFPAVATTAGSALGGLAAAAAVGGVLGALAGSSALMRSLLQPLATLMLGVPAIAWVVLALLWFGDTLAVTFTVAVTAAPIVFASTAEGVGSLDGALLRMARSFRVPRSTLVRDVYAPHLLSYVVPALASALALSFKVAVMTELLSGAGGIGDGLAAARAEVDTARTMAWILVVVVLLLGLEYLLVEPLRRRLQTWRRELPVAREPNPGL